MEKATLTQITRQNKEGINGSYIRLLIKTQEHGDKILSGFGGEYTDQWKKGDSVEIEVEEVEVKGKKFLNFKPVFPKKENGNGKIDSEYARTVSIQLERIEEKVDEVIDRLEKMANFLLEKQGL